MALLIWFGLVWVFVMCHLGKGKIYFTKMLSGWGRVFDLLFSCFFLPLKKKENKAFEGQNSMLFSSQGQLS